MTGWDIRPEIWTDPYPEPLARIVRESLRTMPRPRRVASRDMHTTPPDPDDDDHGRFEVRFVGEEISVISLARVGNARIEQRSKFSDDHDDMHTGGELVRAAIVLASPDAAGRWAWPFEEERPAFPDRRDELAMAAALLVAEIERLTRAMPEDDDRDDDVLPSNGRLES